MSTPNTQGFMLSTTAAPIITPIVTSVIIIIILRMEPHILQALAYPCPSAYLEDKSCQQNFLCRRLVSCFHTWLLLFLLCPSIQSMLSRACQKTRRPSRSNGVHANVLHTCIRSSTVFALTTRCLRVFLPIRILSSSRLKHI